MIESLEIDFSSLGSLDKCSFSRIVYFTYKAIYLILWKWFEAEYRMHFLTLDLGPHLPKITSFMSNSKDILNKILIHPTGL